MQLRIATIGWGSLICDPRTLPLEGGWQKGGPSIPVEFSRVSLDCRLTLVIDCVNGEKVSTSFALSPRTDLRDSVNDLKIREGTTQQNIGYVNLVMKDDSRRQSEQASIHDIIAEWARSHNFTGAVWTALPPNFERKIGKPFSVQNAYEYLTLLTGTVQDVALKYIAKTPEEIMTPLRRKILKRPIANL
jgi:hypothetical protein